MTMASQEKTLVQNTWGLKLARSVVLGIEPMACNSALLNECSPRVRDDEIAASVAISLKRLADDP